MVASDAAPLVFSFLNGSGLVGPALLVALLTAVVGVPYLILTVPLYQIARAHVSRPWRAFLPIVGVLTLRDLTDNEPRRWTATVQRTAIVLAGPAVHFLLLAGIWDPAYLHGEFTAGSYLTAAWNFVETLFSPVYWYDDPIDRRAAFFFSALLVAAYAHWFAFGWLWIRVAGAIGQPRWLGWIAATQGPLVIAGLLWAGVREAELSLGVVPVLILPGLIAQGLFVWEGPRGR